MADVAEEIKQLGIEINKKIDLSNEEVKANKKVSDETKAALKKLTQEWSEKRQKLDDEVKKLGDRADQLDQLMQDGIKSKKQDKALFDVFNEELRKSESFKNGNGCTIKVDTEKAAIDMLRSNALTGEVIEPDRRPGIVTPLMEEVRARSLFNSIRTTSDAITHTEETGFEDGMATTQEGNAPAKSSFTLERKTTNVHKVSSYVRVSDEMIADLPLLMSYINRRLIDKYNDEEDALLFLGDGVNNIEGVYTTATPFNAGGYTNPQANNFHLLRVGQNQLRVLYYRATHIIVSPTTKMELDLTTDGDGRFILPNIFTGQPISIGNARIVEHTAIANNTALFGDFNRGAYIADRTDVTLEVANQDGNDFLDGFKKVKLTKRLALVKNRSAAYSKITDMTAALTAMKV